MKRTAAVFLCALAVVFFMMSYTRISAAGNTNTEPVTDIIRPGLLTTEEITTIIYDITKPPETEETSAPAVTETQAQTETETEPITETAPPEKTTAPPAETAAAPPPETTAAPAESERETVPPPESIDSETRPPKVVAKPDKDKVLAEVTVIPVMPEPLKPAAALPSVPAAPQTAAQTTETLAQGTQTVTAELEPTSAGQAETAFAQSSGEDTSSAETGTGKENEGAPGAELDAKGVIILGAASAAITALLLIYRFSKQPI